jgi:RsiW-degrading membrane proteinase PrsW (M82 family)
MLVDRFKPLHMSLPLLLLIAILPGLAIALFIYLKDIREPEPYGLLMLSVLFGVIAFFISRGIGYLLHGFMYEAEGDMTRTVMSAFFITGLLGEGFKFLFLRGFTFYYKNFNQPFDGIVYAVMVGIGFATAQNVLYALNGDTQVDILPMMTSVPANAVYAVIMGFFLGEAKLFRNRTFLFSALALLLASFVHGFYDYFFFLTYIRGLWLQATISVVIVIVLTHFALKWRKDRVISQQ